MLEKLKQLLATLESNVVPWATKFKALLSIINSLLDVTGMTHKPEPIVLAASIDVESFAIVQIRQAIATLEQPAAQRIGDGELFKNLLPLLLALLKRFIG